METLSLIALLVVVVSGGRPYGPYDGQYCCSPTCDRYMGHMKTKPYLVECPTDDQSDASHQPDTEYIIKADESLCAMDETKRMLKGLGGISTSGGCFVQTKRDLVTLATSYLENMNDPTPQLSKRGRPYGPYDGQYCCSPTCDRYMGHMKTKPYLVECPTDDQSDASHQPDTDLVTLATSYLENMNDPTPQLSKRGRPYGPYDGQYCCSPTCDRYMGHMKTKPYLVECPTD